MRQYDLPNYDNWLNSTNPYDSADYEQREREWLLEEIEEFDGDEEAIEDWLKREGFTDPRKSRPVLGSGS